MTTGYVTLSRNHYICVYETHIKRRIRAIYFSICLPSCELQVGGNLQLSVYRSGFVLSNKYLPTWCSTPWHCLYNTKFKYTWTL